MKIKTLALQALIASLLPLSATAQKNVSMDWYGFVAVQSFVNSRVCASGADDFLNLYPVDKSMDPTNKYDVNDYSNGSWFGTMARLGFTLKGPEVFGAASRAKAEIEFSGHKAPGSVLYRHAFIALDWDKSTLTLGQTWHPMNDLFPSTVGIALGAPFNALNRSPQMRYEYFLGSDRKTKLTGAAIFQAANTSTGASGNSYNYNRLSKVPMLYAGADFTLGSLKIGGGLEYHLIAPGMRKVDGKVLYMGGLSGMIQAQYAKDKISFKAKTLIGQDMAHLGICSGYGKISSIDSTDVKFAPLTAMSTWAQVQYGGDLKFGLMGGYMKNLGAGKDLDLAKGLVFFNGGGKIDNMWRVSPNVQYTVGNLNLGIEYELTTVAYGNIQPNGKVNNTHNVSNHRLLLSAMYAF